MSVELLDQKQNRFKTLVDDDLLRLIKAGDTFALDMLICRYKGFVRAKAQTYFLIGADRDDIVQEGMIGLFKAIRDYDVSKLASFKGFAELCITRQMITAIKMATRQKHMPLNSYVSLDKPIHDEESDRTLIDVIEEVEAVDPQELLIHREKYDEIQVKLQSTLSRLEKQVLHLYLDGCSYQEISEQLGRHIKSIDNALQRVKRKLEQLLIPQ